LRALILAAGRGSRLGFLTKEKPKAFVNFLGVSLLDRAINTLHRSKINDLAIVTGYKADAFNEYSLQKFHNKNWLNSNMVKSLFCADEWLQQDCIIVYSDIFFNEDIITKLVKSEANLSLAFDENWLAQWQIRFKNPLSDLETFKLNSNGDVIEIGTKANDLLEIQGQYMGIFKLTPKSWNEIKNFINTLPTEVFLKISLTELFDLMIRENKTVIKGISNSEFWGEIDSDNDLVNLENYWRDKLPE
jgi:choline kinase